MATTTDIPEMDYAEHERTFRGFRLFTEIGIVHVLCLVLVVAIWELSIQAAGRSSASS